MRNLKALAEKYINNFFNSPEYQTQKEEFLSNIDALINKFLGLMLKEIRTNQKMSQSKFGELLDKKQNTILKYELGILKINIKTWKLVIDTFNITKENFLSVINEVRLEKKYYDDSIDFKVSSLAYNDFLKINNIINHKEDNDSFDIFFNLFIETETKLLERFIEDLFSNLYIQEKFIYFDNASDKSFEPFKLPIIDKTRKEIEEIEELNEKSIAEMKLRKIEKDIENYTLFLLEQNGFVK